MDITIALTILDAKTNGIQGTIGSATPSGLICLLIAVNRRF